MERPPTELDSWRARLICGTVGGDIAAGFGQVDAAHRTIPVVDRDIAHRAIATFAVGSARSKDVTAINRNARAVTVPDHTASIVNAVAAHFRVRVRGAFKDAGT